MTLSITTRFAAAVVLLTPAALGQASDPAAAEAYREGQRAMEAGDHARAAELFEHASLAIPDDPRIHMKIGLARAGMQDWDGAIGAYRRVLQLSPDSSAAHNNIGNIHFRRGDHESAALSYREALKLNPGYILAAYNLGWTARQLNRPDEAERELRRCLSLTPANPQERAILNDARFYLGALRFRARDYEACLSLMEGVVRAVPDHDRAHYYLGQSYLRLGRREEASRELALHQKLSDETPSSGGVATAIGP